MRCHLLLKLLRGNYHGEGVEIRNFKAKVSYGKTKINLYYIEYERQLLTFFYPYVPLAKIFPMTQFKPICTKKNIIASLC